MKVLRSIILSLLFVLTANAEEPIHQTASTPNLDEVSSSTLYFAAQGLSVQAPILDTSIEIDTSGIVSKVRFEQSFENLSAHWVEGLYTFPLPDQAAVHSLIIQVGDRRIVGKVREKIQAEKIYEAAKTAGKIASLVSQVRPNLFTSKIANIAPGQSVSITLEYIQTLSLDNGRYVQRIPLTLTPRYEPPTQNDVTPVKPAFDELNASRGIGTNSHNVSITGRVHGIDRVDSPSHGLTLSTENNITTFELDSSARLDRDFILQWSKHDSDEPSISAWRENVNGEHYLLALINPPSDSQASGSTLQEPASRATIARELIIVIDTSGSMAGDSIQAAQSALIDALSGLSEKDTFNIIEFDNQYSTLFDSPQQATRENVTAGRRFTQRLNAEGGTEMLPALQEALAYAQTDALRQVVLITDGAVGYEEGVMKSVTHRLRNARLFTVGIGSAPNQWFMRKVAESGRGTASFITNLSDVTDVMATLLKSLEAPAVTDLSLMFNDSQVDFTPNPIPDLYAGQPVIVAAKLSDSASAFAATGYWGTEQWTEEFVIDDAPFVSTGLSTVWARRKIEALEDEQRNQNDSDIYQSLITQISLEHQLLSKYTRFVAVDETPVRPSGDTLAKATTPNALPHGSAPNSSGTQTVSFPQGSAGSDTYTLIGLLLMILSLLCWYQQNNAGRVHD